MILAIGCTTLAAGPGVEAADETGPSATSATPETVVLLHGLGRTHRAMAPLQGYLKRSGYQVHNLRYRSTELGPEQLVDDIVNRLDACCGDAPVLHLVGHSLGALLIRAYVAEAAPDNLGRVVMLAPPNHGSEIVDRVGGWALFEALLGPTAQQLGTSAESFPNRLPAPDYPVGIIAGTDTVNPIGTLMIPGEDDGMVSVASTRLDNMTDFVAVPWSHAFIMRSDEIGALVAGFLRQGRFPEGADE